VTGDQVSDQSRSAFSALLRKETIILIVLAAATIPLFFFTRTMAAWNRESNVRAGRTWYERAQEPLRQGISVTAIDYLRKATAADRDNLQYSLSLAEELITIEQTAEARQILVRLRDSRPEDGRINLDLARLSVKDDEVEVARRYYHQALYGMWPVDQVETEQSTIRMEFVRFLMTQRDTSNADSELLILAANSPADAATKTELGWLFLQAEEPVRARSQFSDALKLEPKNASALRGAGQSEFKLGNDDAARKQLQLAAQQGPLPPDSQRALDLVGLILSDDPLASGIGTRERWRRLTQALQRAGDRLEACGKLSALPDPGAVETFKDDATRIGRQISGNGSGSDLDLLRDGLRIASKAETSAKETCGPASDADEAIILAAERHKVNVP
jgi:tetratricopeptide (TPR) repeat protein